MRKPMFLVDESENDHVRVDIPVDIGDTIYVMIDKLNWINLKVMDFVYYPSCGFCIVSGYFGVPKSILPVYRFGIEFFLRNRLRMIRLQRIERLCLERR